MTAPNVRSDHVDTTMPKLVTDSPSGFAIKAPIYLATYAAINWRGLQGKLLIALTCIRCS